MKHLLVQRFVAAAQRKAGRREGESLPPLPLRPSSVKERVDVSSYLVHIHYTPTPTPPPHQAAASPPPTPDGSVRIEVVQVEEEEEDEGGAGGNGDTSNSRWSRDQTGGWGHDPVTDVAPQEWWGIDL